MMAQQLLLNQKKDKVVDLLVKNSVFEARTQKEILALGNVRVGVKSSEAIGRMDTDVFFQDDIQALLDEITALRQQVLDAQTALNEINQVRQ